MKRLLLVLVLGASCFGCSGGDAAPDASEGAEGSPDPCFGVTEGWEELMAATAASHAACFTAADCTWLTYDLACEGGTAVSTCGEPVSVDGEAAARAELEEAAAHVCEQHPAGCIAMASCGCVLPFCDEGTSFRVACLDHRCVIADTVSFDELAFEPTERPAVAGFDQTSAFVPDWCSSQTEGSSEACQCTTLDCPALADPWPCSSFRAPLPFTAALTPERPLLRRQVVQPLAGSSHPECQCSGGIRTFEWSGLGPYSPGGGMYRTCQSLVALVDGAPAILDSPEALRAAFAPVETPAEALAFATVLGVGAPRRGELKHVFSANDLQALRPYSQDAEHGCLNAPLQGTRIEAVEGGFRVVTFAPDAVCEPDFVNEVTLFVATGGEVTLEAKRTICWYENYLCVE